MKKMMLLALAAASVAMFALPAVASAGEPEVHCPVNVACGAFTSHGGASTLSSGSLTVTCTSNTGSGNFATKKTGTFQLTFHGCKDSAFGSNCNSTGQPAGTIKTNVMSFRNVYLTHGTTVPGVTVEGANTTFTCFGGFSHHLVTGNVLGTLTNPKCGGTAASLTLSFVATSHGVQQHKLVTGTGTPHTLLDNGAAAAMNATGTVTAGGKNMTVTCV